MIQKQQMAQLTILRYPDPRLMKPSEPVEVFDDALKKLVEDMGETMYKAPGVGLAAPQVNVRRRIIVVDTSEKRDNLMVLINPEIISLSEERKIYEEGCLSLPHIYEKVERPAQVKVKAQDVHGNWFELEGDGLLAVCLQHEIDHLKGTVFVDYLSPMKRNRIKTKLLKEERELKKAASTKSPDRNKKGGKR